MNAARLASIVVGFGLASWALAACQAVAGIEDRTFDKDFDKPPASAQCKEYCATVMDACTGDDAQYTTEEICLGVCAQLDPGDDEDTHNNTVACRLFYANDAKREHASCAAAGPGGDGVCGTDCEAYCQLFPAVCPNDFKYGSTKECLKFCNTLPTHTGLNVAIDHDGDTVECRLVHTSSATTKPVEHCPHAQIPPSRPYCIDIKATDIPSCDDYCNIALAACEGDVSQYESREQCMAVCGALDPGTNDDQKENTVGCRRYHSFSASTLPRNHCYHSGPTGDGHCGLDDLEQGHTANCDSYCQLLAAACPGEFDSLGGTEECVKECIDLPEAPLDSKYSVANAELSTGLNCRILYTARAFADTTACASAIGNDQCK
jgi:hypothetical protein